MYRDGYANEYGWAGVFMIVPHVNWRGRFDAGTYPAGVAPGVYTTWPGDEDRVFHSTPSPSGGRGDWMGGLLNEQKDASGLMYRRNRYYDPQTGRFTQEDPIGIAGGLNVYGYAAGDPVSYSDPYGLCPEHLEEADGSCPGGMTHDEYYRMEDLIMTRTTGSAQTGLREMLQTGRIVTNEAMQEGETRVQVFHYADATPSYLRLGPDFWSEGADAAAFMLTHDYGHVLQKERRGFIYANDPPLSLSTWNAVTRSRGFGPGGGIADIFQRHAG